MNEQQLQRPAASVGRLLTGPAIGLSAVVALIILALAAALVARQPASAPATAPAARQATVESWSPGGHITGSVYDGGDYTRRTAVPWSPGGHITGSVYDGGDYGAWRQAAPVESGVVTVTGLVFDGTRYVTAPVTTSAGGAGTP